MNKVSHNVSHITSKLSVEVLKKLASSIDWSGRWSFGGVQRGVSDNKPRRAKGSLSSLVSNLLYNTRHKTGLKKDGPYITAGELREGGRRSAADVVSVGLLIVDCDDVVLPSLLKTTVGLFGGDTVRVMHNTWSDGTSKSATGLSRVRLVFPLSTALSPLEYATFYEIITGLYGTTIGKDDCGKRSCQPMFTMRSNPDGNTPWMSIDGTVCLDPWDAKWGLQDAMVAAQEAKAQKAVDVAATREARAANELANPTRDGLIVAALEHLDYDTYPVWAKVGMCLKSRGDAGLDIWLQWSAKSDKYSESAALSKWRQFSVNGGRTVLSLLYDARSAGFDQKAYEALNADDTVYSQGVESPYTDEDADNMSVSEMLAYGVSLGLNRPVNVDVSVDTSIEVSAVQATPAVVTPTLPPPPVATLSPYLAALAPSEPLRDKYLGLVDDEWNAHLLGKKYRFLIGPTGTGKSTYIVSCLEAEAASGLPTLAISSRKALAADLAHKLGIALYSDCDVVEGKYDRVSISVTVDSLWRVPVGAYNIVLDETDSTLHHLVLSDTMRGMRTETLTIIHAFLDESPLVLCASAHLSTTDVKCILREGRASTSEAAVSWHVPPKRDMTVYDHPNVESISRQLDKSLAAGKRVWVFCETTMLGQIAAMKLLEHYNPTALAAIGPLGDEEFKGARLKQFLIELRAIGVMLYMSTTSHNNTQARLAHAKSLDPAATKETPLVESLITIGHRGVVCTSSISEGVDIPRGCYDETYLFFTGRRGGIDARGAVQGFGRNRGCKVAHVCFNDATRTAPVKSREVYDSLLSGVIKSTDGLVRRNKAVDEPLLRITAERMALNNIYSNTRKKTFLRLLKGRGAKIVRVNSDKTTQKKDKEEKGVRKDLKDTSNDWRVEQVIMSVRLRSEEASTLSSKDERSIKEQGELFRYRIENAIYVDGELTDDIIRKCVLHRLIKKVNLSAAMACLLDGVQGIEKELDRYRVTLSEKDGLYSARDAKYGVQPYLLRKWCMALYGVTESPLTYRGEIKLANTTLDTFKMLKEREEDIKTFLGCKSVPSRCTDKALTVAQRTTKDDRVLARFKATVFAPMGIKIAKGGTKRAPTYSFDEVVQNEMRVYCKLRIARYKDEDVVATTSSVDATMERIESLDILVKLPAVPTPAPDAGLIVM